MTIGSTLTCWSLNIVHAVKECNEKMPATPSLLLNTSSVLPPKWNHNKFMGSNLLEYQTIVRKRKQLSDIPFFSGVYRTQWKSNRMDPHWNIPLVDINMFALNIHQSKKKLVVWVVPSVLATANRYLTFFWARFWNKIEWVRLFGARTKSYIAVVATM